MLKSGQELEWNPIFFSKFPLDILWLLIRVLSNLESSPPLGLGPWQNPSLGIAKKGRVGRLSRRPSSHRGCSVPMDRWTNAGGSIDGHLPIAWREPYKRVYPRLKSGGRYRRVCPHVWRSTYRRALSWMRQKANWCMESPGRHCKASAVCDQEQYKRSFPYGVPLGMLRHWVVSPPDHEEARLLWA